MALVVEPMPELGITRVSRWMFNCYVIHNAGSPIVVDAGLPNVARDLAPILTPAAGVLQAILATHAHSDHVAGAPGLSARHGAPILLPQRGIDYVDRRERPRTPNMESIAKIYPTMIDQPLDPQAAMGLARGSRIAGFGTSKGMVWPSLPQPQPLEVGVELAGAPDWSVIAVPGHTDDSIAFWNATTKTLLSGDAVLSSRGQAWFTPEVVDPGAAYATERSLRELPVEHLLPGHGKPIHGAGLWLNAK